MAKKIELLHTTYDESGNIESQEVVHPLTSPDCIIMENGKTLDEVMGDGIATPTLTHEGTSFKVGVGDSNIEVVDGDVAGMTLKGQSYQNILPKPTTLIMETDEKEFKINDKIDSNIIIDDNIAEIATVKGKTIVNAVQEESASEYTVLGEDLSGQSIVTTNKPEGNIKGVTLQGQTLVNTIQEPCKDACVVLDADNGNLAYDTIIKPSTLYTIRFKHDTVNTDNPLTVDLGGTVQEVTSTKFTITTPSTLTHNQLVFSGKNNVVSEVQVIEGDVTNIEYPFFEGMNDVQITDMTRNVNLFDINDTVSGYLNLTGEIVSPDHGNLTSNYIKVKPNTTYVYNHSGYDDGNNFNWTAMKFYKDNKGSTSTVLQDTTGTIVDKNGKAYYISSGRYTITGKTGYNTFQFTTPSDCEYIRIGSRGLSYDGAWATLYQLDNFNDSKFISTGKNLFDISSYVKGKREQQCYSQNGNKLQINALDERYSAEYFTYKIKKGETITLSTNPKIPVRIFNITDQTMSNSTTDGILTISPNEDIEVGFKFIAYEYPTLVDVQLEKSSTATPYVPYQPSITVQQDVDSIPLTSDMFEQNGFNLDNYDATGFSIQQLNIWITTRRIKSKTMIKVKPNTNYVYGDSVIGYALFFDKNGLYIGRDNTYNSITTTHDTQYIAMCLQSPQDLTTDTVITPSALDSMNLILQEVPQEIVLRSIRDVKDELDLTRGEYIQRIGEIVLDGSDDEIWYPSGLNQDLLNAGRKNLVFYYNQENNGTIPNLKTSPYSELSNIICDKLISTPHEHQLIANVTHDYPSITGGINVKELRIAIPVDNSTTQQDSPTCKAWLKQNPIKVQYELATPIIHKVNLTNTKVIQSYATETHYETITPSDSLIPNITIPSTLNYDVAIKPSTEYTIRVNTSDNLTVDLGGTTGTLSNGKVTLTTPATLTHNEVKFSGTGKVKELMVVEGSEIKDNVPFFNGMKDVQMGGIKLVNIARWQKCSALVTANTNKTQFTYTSDGANAYHTIYFDSSLLKTNTVYTVFADITTNTSDVSKPLKFQFGYASGDILDVVKGFVGKIKQTITSANTTKDGLSIVFRPCSSGGKVVIQNPMIIEGDWTHLDEIPYIESEMIIDQPIIRSQGKNLLDLESKYFNPSNVTYSKSGTTYTVVGNTENYNYGQFAWTTETSSWFRNLLGKEVTLSVSSISCTNTNSKACIQVRMECTDGSKVYKTISTNDDAKYETFTIPSNAIDMALQLMSNNTGSPLDSESTLTVSGIRLELGSTATSYEPFKHQTLYSNRVIGYEEGVHYVGTNGLKVTNEIYNSVMADVEGLSIAYVTNGSSNFTFWDKDGVYISGKSYLDTSLSKDNTNGFIQVPSNAKYMKFVSGNTIGSATDYTKATVTGELPLRSLPNGVCDTLNLVTGEYVQNIKEVVIDGSENWFIQEDNTKTEKTIYCRCISFPDSLPLPSDWDNNAYNVNLNCDNLTVYSSDYMWKNEVEGISRVQSSRYLRIRLNKNKLDTPNLAGFKQYLSQNPITVQYQLEIPIVRKLGFTTKGNYRQANLATDCEWGASPTTANNTFTTRYRTKSASSLPIVYNTHLFSNDFPIRYFNVDAHKDYEYISNMEYGQYVNVRRDKLEADTPEAFSKWLQHNPIEVGYITWEQSSESYSNIHKPIFFNNVNVQYLPNNVDIQPELTYQVRTRNSYVMEMMKPNTTYTMKCLAYSNSAKLYVVNSSANTSVSSNKTLQFAQSHLDGSKNELVLVGQWYEPMIIEGDVTGKNLPYFKGILSSYHDVDEIELYSVNKNLFDISKVKPYEGRATYWWNTIVKENEVVSVRIGDINNGQFGAYIKLNVRPNSTYTLYIEMEKDGEPYNGQIYGYENGDLWGNGTFHGYANTPYHIKTSHNAKYITIGFNYGKDFPIGTTLVSKNMRLYLGEENPIYIPHSHSTTLIEMPTRLETIKVVRPIMEKGQLDRGNGQNYNDDQAFVRTKEYIPVTQGEVINIQNANSYRAMNIIVYDINKSFVQYIYTDGSGDVVIPKNGAFIRGYCGVSATSDLTITRQTWKPIQLNSLPNGVYDEIIMKPNSSKAQLVQRVGKVVLNGSGGNYYPQIDKQNNITFMQISGLYLPLAKNTNGLLPTHTYCDKLLVGNPFYKVEQGVPSDKSCVGVYEDFVRLCLHELDESEQVYRNYLQQNPITVYYELATPIIHEIQLKGYPHVYENGIVTLNTDTPHQTLVSYNVNQEQLINTQNETIIRHDQQIDDLYYYIEIYLEEIYQMELFRMKLELSL